MSYLSSIYTNFANTPFTKPADSSCPTQETKEEIEHLASISTALDIAQKEEDLVQIKEELIESGYIRRKGGTKRVKITSKPFHYISSDGFDIYVGKNNYQNEELTFKFATGNDWWFHAKGMPGRPVAGEHNTCYGSFFIL